MPSRAIPLWVLLAREDHPRACTGRRLLAQRLARPYPGAERLPSAPVVLDPHANTPLSRADRARARRSGVLVVDCSWNRLRDRGRFPRSDRPLGPARRLPLLIATNPQHFGNVTELTTAEAFGAALFVLGETGPARALLDGFAGGPAFFEVNAALLRRYAEATLPEGVLAAESAAFSGSGDAHGAR